MNPTGLIILSHATYVGPSGATAAATYMFLTKEYKPPAQPRYLDFDIVKNQNGQFKWVYDNGPGFKRWPTFMIACRDRWETLLGVNAQAQYQRLLELWNYKGVLGMQAPEGQYLVHWSSEALENNFVRFPASDGDEMEFDVAVQFEEG